METVVFEVIDDKIYYNKPVNYSYVYNMFQNCELKNWERFGPFYRSTINPDKIIRLREVIMDTDVIVNNLIYKASVYHIVIQYVSEYKINDYCKSPMQLNQKLHNFINL